MIEAEDGLRLCQAQDHQPMGSMVFPTLRDRLSPQHPGEGDEASIEDRDQQQTGRHGDQGRYWTPGRELEWLTDSVWRRERDSPHLP